MDARSVQEALRGSGALPANSRVVGVEVVGLGGAGLVGEVRRLRLTYSGEPGPGTLVWKVPAGGGFAAVEREFHRAGIASVAVPAVYHVGDSGELLMADLGDEGFVRQVVGLRADQAGRALREVAGLHRGFRGRPLPLPIVTTPVDSAVAGFCRDQIQTWDGPWPHALGRLPALLGTHFDRVAGLLDTPDRTLAHGDFHSQNLHLGPTACTLIDFQFLQHASGMLDVARLLATSLTTEMRRAAEAELLAEYESAAGAPIDTTALRAGLLWNFTTPIALHLAAMRTGGTSWPARLPILERCLTAAEDWDALALLE